MKLHHPANPFSKEQIDLLQKLLIQSQSAPSNSVIGTSSIAQKSNFLSALGVQTEKSSPWIIDSGACDHMTGNPSLFHTYSRYFENFKDLDSGRTIGSVDECEGLYLLRVNASLGKQTQNASCVSFSPTVGSNTDSEIMLWHYRLGHPSFMQLEKLFP
ncbi:hypothetical protein Q3G72_035375 [Acer saccharum]|nr:hypothetical protein Q3G72_035375 [Acer saccharum]